MGANFRLSNYTASAGPYLSKPKGGSLSIERTPGIGAARLQAQRSFTDSHSAGENASSVSHPMRFSGFSLIKRSFDFPLAKIVANLKRAYISNYTHNPTNPTVTKEHGRGFCLTAGKSFPNTVICTQALWERIWSSIRTPPSSCAGICSLIGPERKPASHYLGSRPIPNL